MTMRGYTPSKFKPHILVMETSQVGTNIRERMAAADKVAPFHHREPSFKDGRLEGYETALLTAAMRAGIHVIFYSAPGLGKTTLADNIAEDNKIPIATIVGDRGIRAHDLIGYTVMVGDKLIFNDGPIGEIVRYTHGLDSSEDKTNIRVRALIYLDELVNFARDVLQKLTELFDHRRRLSLGDTGELLSFKEGGIIAAFNQVEPQDIYLLPKAATLDRFIAIPLAPYDADQMTELAHVRYANTGIRASRITLLEQPRSLEEVTKQYAETLSRIAEALRTGTEMSSFKQITYGDYGFRGVDHAIQLIRHGIDPEVAAWVSIVTPRFPIAGQEAQDALRAAHALIKAKMVV